MTWDQATNSTAVFRSWVADTLAREPGLEAAWAATLRYQLICFSGNVTPDRNATAAGSSYGGGTWDLAEEVYDPRTTGNVWPQSGIQLATSPLVMPDGFGLALAPITKGPVTLTGPAGDLLIDIRSNPPGRGLAYHYWGGIQDVLNGSLTLTWFTNQAIRFTFGPPPPVPPLPVVTSVNPAAGPAGGGTGVGIFGANFSGVTGVAFGGVPAVSFVEIASGEVQVTTPPGTPGPVDVAVTTPNGTGTAAGAFTYT
jgi:IPT/TIG domain